MSLQAVPYREKSFEKPSSKALNVGAPTFSGVRRLDAAFEAQGMGTKVRLGSLSYNRNSGSKVSALQDKPSEITLNVGAPTFLPEQPPGIRAGLKPGTYMGFALRQSSAYVGAGLQRSKPSSVGAR